MEIFYCLKEIKEFLKIQRELTKKIYTLEALKYDDETSGDYIKRAEEVIKKAKEIVPEEIKKETVIGECIHHLEKLLNN